MQLRYSFRLYPSAGQRMALAKAFGCARVVYNDALRARETARGEGMPFPKTGNLSKQLITEAKNTPERAWLGEVSAVVLQQSLRDLDTAYKNFFDGLKGKRPRMGAPRYRSRKDTRQAVRFTANARWSITTGGKLHLPKIGGLKVKWSRMLPSTPSTVTVVKDSAGRYFASFVVETGPEEILPETTPELGIDLGLGHFAVLSDGTKIDSPRFLRRAEKRLKKAQRVLSRKEKGSKNRDKARVRVARAHARVADARRELHHQLSTQLIRENQAVAVEDLAVKGLARTRLAKSVHDAGWAAFVSMLEYKAARYGRTLIRIGRFEPTSQVCSQCGVKDGPKPLHVRVWTCGACGAVLDRDINAAVNVAKAAGLVVSACGAQVRRAPVPAPRSEAGTHSTPQPSTAR
ncbi:transposase [Streptomyces sp. KPB2]|uniref:RNA-guided endonuclease InsQ/TnpB family protein n=1 Tax=Streptomyces TaxID=1883 RepID=UPI000F6FF25F|nr:MULTISPECIES: RNA-guided endonuclease TnpB family protein [Streptomyces]AZM77516.1 transposase [Streptomyces sp. KPB2]MDU0254120.1 RNA-guided endonuclease TnpB family protein [Streptomyces sp. PU10]QKW63110.1 IS200/IS605 family element transposase accessory protein TnpB [Streptomyces sp. NA03103]WSU03469.1 transposase [Streptomyces sp. NBC_01124]